jgi:hypothetical protein
LKEREMYPILEKFIEEKGFEILPRRRYKFEVDIGQRDIMFDVTGYKDGVLWIVECKKPCTIEQFGFAFGQLMCYSFLIEQGTLADRKQIGRPINPVHGTVCSIALLENEKYRLSWELSSQFERFMKYHLVPFGFITVYRGEVREHIKTRPSFRSLWEK